MLTLLLIDDEADVEAFVRQSLPEGTTLAYASTLEAGIDQATTHDYDLILVDLRMPGTTNGDALTRVLEACPSTAVMVLTALHFPAYAASLIRQGAIWVSFKPDAAIEPAIAERLLREAIMFAIARYDAQRQQLLAHSEAASAIERLERELRELRPLSREIAVLQEQHRRQTLEIETCREGLDHLQERFSTQAAEREKGKWGLWARIIALAGTGLAALIGPWAASRWGKP